MPLATTQIPRRVVLDTNVVLDWLVFDDPRCDRLQAELSRGRAAVATHKLAVEELRRVLAYTKLALSVACQATVLARYLEFAQEVDTPSGFSATELLLPPRFPRCRDRDDQFLLALAYHGRADFLLTRDKRLLELARRARAFGVNIGNIDR